MFTRKELQIIGQTLVQKRDWIQKNLANPDYASNRALNESTLEVIESCLQKLSAKYNSSTEAPKPAKTEDSREPVSHYVTNKGTSPIRQAAIQKRQNMSAADIRVLLVDDDQLIGDLMTAYLEALGIVNIQFANDGMAGITMMYEANPVFDLVLCDWNMPVKNGLDVHNAMRAAERYHGTVFMLVTAVTEAKQIRAAIDEGVDDYVVKPIEQEKLVKKISRFFPQIK